MSTCFLGSLAPHLCFRGTTPRSSPLAALDGNEQLLRAAGGLLRFLEQNATLLGDLQGRWQGPCVQDSSQLQRLKNYKEMIRHVAKVNACCTMSDLTFWLEDIRIFSPDDAVFVDTQTMIALQIFQDPRASRSTRWRSVELPRFTIPIVLYCFLMFSCFSGHNIFGTYYPCSQVGSRSLWLLDHLDRSFSPLLLPYLKQIQALEIQVQVVSGKAVWYGHMRSYESYLQRRDT